MKRVPVVIMVVRMKRLPGRHRIAHLRALIRHNLSVRPEARNWLRCCATKCRRSPGEPGQRFQIPLSKE